MHLEGIHHVTALTADAQANADFYVEVLGLRMVKKTVNYDAPDVYHLYYGDERGTPGSIVTFFEFPGARRARAGAGMVHTVTWRVADAAALDFWAARLEHAGRPVERRADALATSDPEGMGFELVLAEVGDAPLVAAAPDVPPEHALQGIAGVRAYARDPRASAALLEALGFAPDGDGDAYGVGGDLRHGRYRYDPAPEDPGIRGAGAVHHVAWAAHDDEHAEWQAAARRAGARPTPVLDRTYFRSIYFREPGGVLFEIATLSPGFAVDEPADALGERLVLPPRHEPRRSRLERILTPVVNPRGRTTAET